MWSQPNSGVYLRGRYEVQIETDSIDEPPSHHTGGVYGFLAPSPEMPRKPGEWQTFDKFATIPLESTVIVISRSGRSMEIVKLLAKVRDSSVTVI